MTWDSTAVPRVCGAARGSQRAQRTGLALGTSARASLCLLFHRSPYCGRAEDRLDLWVSRQRSLHSTHASLRHLRDVGPRSKAS